MCIVHSMVVFQYITTPLINTPILHADIGFLFSISFFFTIAPSLSLCVFLCLSEAEKTTKLLQEPAMIEINRDRKIGREREKQQRNEKNEQELNTMFCLCVRAYD